jgi:hypothetical protein
LPEISADEVARLVRKGKSATIDRRLAMLIRGSARVEALTDEQLLAGTRELLNMCNGFSYPSTDLYGLGWFSEPRMWTRIITEFRYGRRYLVEPRTVGPAKKSPRERAEQIYGVGDRILKSFGEARDHGLSSGADVIAAMDKSIAVMREVFGKTFMEIEVASMAASISARGGRGKGATELLDDSRSLVDRFRYARGQLNRPDWWSAQLDAGKTDYDRYLWILACFAWSSPDTLGTLLPIFESTVSLLPLEARRALVRACKRAEDYSRANKGLRGIRAEAHNELTDPTAISILWRRLPLAASADLMRILSQQEMSAPYIADAVLRCTALNWFQGGRVSPSDMIRTAVRCHDSGALEETDIRSLSRSGLRSLGVDWAKSAISNGWSMPSDMLYMAYRVLDQERPDPEAVLKVAERQDWFGGDTWGRRL